MALGVKFTLMIYHRDAYGLMLFICALYTARICTFLFRITHMNVSRADDNADQERSLPDVA